MLAGSFWNALYIQRATVGSVMNATKAALDKKCRTQELSRRPSLQFSHYASTELLRLSYYGSYLCNISLSDSVYVLTVLLQLSNYSLTSSDSLSKSLDSLSPAYQLHLSLACPFNHHSSYSIHNSHSRKTTKQLASSSNSHFKPAMRCFT